MGFWASDKHLPQSPFTGKFCMAFYESYLSTGLLLEEEGWMAA
jgi:hypothetical protein